MNMRFLKSVDKKKLLAELGEKFGIERLPYVLIETGREKIRGFSGTMSKEEIMELSEIANVEIVGAYLFKKEGGGVRLSLDATQILKEDIVKNVFEINEEQFYEWIRGRDLEIETGRGIYVIKFGDDFVGCGVSDGKKMINYMPKERRIRN